ncbi:TonB-dependent receptor [Sphingobium sufflavum]|uniref:TonB-dependent receptor plug domain-containing protein n=1 Tax=Sphingobium sufflavum TaxID=1129547 RepID=UPI001F25AFAC|nr:TonB-dependent receptor [Sphingobium sufflavum]MCE7797142.1 TonB-dependent receptor [Sphingobium sufflavum]
MKSVNILRKNPAALSGVARRAMATAMVSIMLATPAYAQTRDKEKVQDAVSDQDIIVTGTLIRGQGPTGSDIKAITTDDIAQLGIANTSQLLGAVPADSNFNSRPQVGGFGQYQTVNAPILRYLGGGAAGSNSTLLLLNGRRMPGMGVTQTSSDIDAIAPGALQGVDMVADGGSATYGADAVGGVVNLITRKRFNGLEVGGHFGGADSYRQWDVSVTAGKTWDRASIWASYNYAHHGLLYKGDRDYPRDLDYTTNPPSPINLNCSPGNYQAGGLVIGPQYPGGFAFLPITNYGLVNGVPTPGTVNRCDLSRRTTLLPEEDRHSFMAGLDVELSDSISANVTGYFTRRRARNDGGPIIYNVTTSYPGLPNGTIYGNLAANSDGRTSLDTWGISPELKIDLGSDWRAVIFYNHGEGLAQFMGGAVDQSALQAATNNGAFNPFTNSFAGTSAGQAAQTYQANYRAFSSGRDIIDNARLVIDGPLFKLPGGEVRAAVGAEIMREEFTQRNGTALLSNLGSIAAYSTHRTVKSLFGELSVPIFGPDNATAGFQSLVFSAAGRYDDYTDFGGTFNPKLGLTWKPTSWWTLRGNWGKSYQAPSLASKAEVIPTALQVFPANTFGAPGNTAGKFILLLYPGGGINLRPQKATTWQIGTDIRPAAIPGLSASVTYYHIDFKDRIAFPSFFTPAFYNLFPNSYVLNSTANPLTAAQILSYVSSVSPSLLSAANLQTYLDDPSKVYALENGLSQNLSEVKTSGLDFTVEYNHSTSFGSVFGGVAGTYILTYKTRASSASPVQGLDDNNVIRLRTAATLGAKVGDLLGKITWNRTGEFHVLPTATNLNQSRVGAFNVFNLAFQYDVKGEGALKDLTISLNVDNVFDTDPPHYNGNLGAGAGYSGFTIGRFLQLGLTKKF